MIRMGPFYLILLTLLISLAIIPAISIADNSIKIIAPDRTFGSYGNDSGQIYNPCFVATDQDDIIYVLQEVFYDNGDRNVSKRVISVFDSNGHHTKTIDVLKRKGMGESFGLGEDIGGGFYEDTGASAIEIGPNGRIYLLSSYEIIILEKDGSYVSQFSVWPNAKWMFKTGSGVSYHYPRGLAIDDEGRIYTSTGDSPAEHAILALTGDGNLITRMDADAPNGINSIMIGPQGTLTAHEIGSNNVSSYNRYLNCIGEVHLDLQHNGTQQTYVSVLPDGRYVLSAGGVHIFNQDGKLRKSFTDSAGSSATWNRPMTVDSKGRMIMVSSHREKNTAPQPIIVYQPSTINLKVPGITEESRGGYYTEQQSGIVKGYRQDYQPCSCCIPYAPLYIVYGCLETILKAI